MYWNMCLFLISPPQKWKSYRWVTYRPSYHLPLSSMRWLGWASAAIFTTFAWWGGGISLVAISVISWTRCAPSWGKRRLDSLVQSNGPFHKGPCSYRPSVHEVQTVRSLQRTCIPFSRAVILIGPFAPSMCQSAPSRPFRRWDVQETLNGMVQERHDLQLEIR